MTDPTHAGGGAFFDLGSHAVDTVLWMLGQKPVRATSMTGRVRAMSAQGCDHYGEGLIEFGDGTLASVAAAWVDFDQPIRCTITGTEGHACVHGHGGPLYLKTPHVRGADGTRPFTEVPGDRPLCFDLFIDALAQNQAVEYITAAEAANVDAVHDAMRRGAAEKTWVDCPWFG
jgi:predicted dehydrogenase